jgi:hypothetical protein
MMMDYDATVAFDRVLHVMSIITCRHIGLLISASHFMIHLLHNMEFHLVTGFGRSALSFINNEDPDHPGQGILQGSSSAAPIYNICTDVSLTAYKKIASGATFTHPITGAQLMEFATQFVDDKTEMVNLQGATITPSCRSNITAEERVQLFQTATDNSTKWASLLWMSGGNLNLSKCYYYYIQPKYNFTSQKISYATNSSTPGDRTVINPATKTATIVARVLPTEAR